MNKQRNTKAGFALIEVVVGTVLLAMAFSALLSYIQMSRHTKMLMAARTAAALYAHSRCEQFSAGLVESDVFTHFDAGNPTATYQFAIPEGAGISNRAGTLTGGFPVNSLTDVITFSSDGKCAYLSVNMMVETSRAKNSAISATAARYR